MQIYNDVKKRVGTLEGFLNRSVTKTLSTGDKELSFDYPSNGDKVDLLKEEYYINDYYMIDNSQNLKNIDNLEILKKCILVREILGKEKVLLYKYKKYATDGSIIEQGKTECPIEDVDKAIRFMNAIIKNCLILMINALYTQIIKQN